MTRRMKDGTAVIVSGCTDPETTEPIEDQPGVIVSGGHVVGDVHYYDVQIEGAAFTSFVEADRVTRAE